ncbi:hypothetical protein M1D72_15215 [Vibrio sp. AK197]
MRSGFGMGWLLSFQLAAADVLVIESYRSQFEWDKSYLFGIYEELNPSIELVTFEMDTKRIPMNQFDNAAEAAWHAYRQHQPKVVVLGDDNALRLMLPKLYDQPISIVFLGINDNPRHLLSEFSGQAKVTGILERPLFVRNLSEISRVLGKTDLRIKVMFDSGVTSKIAGEYIVTQFEQIKAGLGIDVSVHNIATFREWQAQVNQAQSQGVDAIFVGLYHTIIDDQGRNVAASTIMKWTNQHASVPLFGFWDYAVGKGKTAGGVVLFGESQGRTVAQLVNRILNGEDAGLIPIKIGTQGRAIYSRSEMTRWQLKPPLQWQALE